MLSRQLPTARAALILLASFLLTLLPAQVTAVAQQASASSIALVSTIDTSVWRPPSPDPAGITYWPAHNTLMVADSEVDEMDIFQGVNLFEATTSGVLSQTHTTMPFSKEPVAIDIAVDPGNGHFFISDDNQERVFEVDIGRDERIGTGDDTVTSFSTSAFGSDDPEGIAFAAGKLFLSDGASAEIYSVDPGPNGLFDGIAPAGDDQVSHFDVEALGQRDPEGVAYNSDTGTLFITSRRSSPISEVTLAGALLRNIDISSLDAVGPSDLTFAPASDGSGVMHLYITDRGVDNNSDPNENDGKIYEVSLASGSPGAPPAPAGLVASAGNQQVALSWEAVSEAASYRVKRSTTSGGPYTTIASPSATSFTDSGLSNGVTYYYVVSALNDSGESASSSEVAATPLESSELLSNGSFERDAAPADGAPDSWSTDSRFTRSNEIAAHDGAYVGRFYASDGSSFSIKQKVTASTAPAQFACWISIPATSASFRLKLFVQWRDASNDKIASELIAVFEEATSGWQQAAASLTPPPGTAYALVRLRAASLDTTIYVDQCSLRQ